MDIAGFGGAPQYAATGLRVVFTDGAGAQRLDWGADGPGSFNSGASGRILDFSAECASVPLGSWSLEFKSEAGPVQVHVVVALAY